MKKKLITAIVISAFTIGMLSACGNNAQGDAQSPKQDSLETETAKKAEEADDCYEKGRSCLYGLNGQAIDYKAAYDNFVQALEKGKTEANFYLGVLCDWYGYPEVNYERARIYYEAAGDNPYAQISLGFFYLVGLGVAQDAAKAQEIFDAVVAGGCADGYLGYAAVAEWEEDYAKELEYCNKVAMEGQEPLYTSEAMTRLGICYRNSLGVEQDYAKAFEWFQKAADLGLSDAMNNIGWLYEKGKGVEQDYAKALVWYQKAADLGFSNAMNHTGWLYANGLGVEQDYAKALVWYQKAADLGLPAAMNNIGDMYANGKGVEQDYAKAFEWFQKAADLGLSDAMNNIGWLYEKGKGVEQDYAKALVWYQKAEEAE